MLYYVENQWDLNSQATSQWKGFYSMYPSSDFFFFHLSTIIEFSIFTHVYPLQGTKATKDRWLLKEIVVRMIRLKGKKYRLCEYLWEDKLTIDLKRFSWVWA